MKLTKVQREILRLMVKWERHYPGIETDYDTYGMLLPGCERWVRWETIQCLEEKGLIMQGPVLPLQSHLPVVVLMNPLHFITTIEGQQLGERLLEKSGEEKVPIPSSQW